MRRREFIALVGGAAAWPTTATAQPAAKATIGFLDSASFEMRRNQLVSFHRTLNEAGYIEGQNLAIEYRYAEGQYDRLPAMAADLARHPVAVMVAGGPNAALAIDHHPNCFRERDRSGETRTGRKLQQTRRQCHGHVPIR